MNDCFPKCFKCVFVPKYVPTHSASGVKSRAQLREIAGKTHAIYRIRKRAATAKTASRNARVAPTMAFVSFLQMKPAFQFELCVGPFVFHRQCLTTTKRLHSLPSLPPTYRARGGPSCPTHFCLRPLASRRPSSRFGNLAEVPWVKVQKFG